MQVCGDAHLSNFGVFGSAERRLIFDVNDFDETLPGPWEWDVKRLAASLEVAARGNEFTPGQRRGIVTAAVARYRRAMRSFAVMTNLDVWYAHVDMDQLRSQYAEKLQARQRKVVDKGLAKARARDDLKESAKLARVVDGKLRIDADPPLLVPVDDLNPKQTDRATMEEQFRACSSGTVTRWKPTAGSCSSSSGSPTWPARLSVWVASGRAAGSC